MFEGLFWKHQNRFHLDHRDENEATKMPTRCRIVGGRVQLWDQQDNDRGGDNDDDDEDSTQLRRAF